MVGRWPGLSRRADHGCRLWQRGSVPPQRVEARRDQRSARCKRSRMRRRKQSTPGALRPRPLRRPGRLQWEDHPPLVDLSALASTRPTSPVVPEGMAGDAALSARLRVAPLRSRHEGIRPTRSGRIRIDCGGPLVKILNSGGAPLPKPGCNPPLFKTLADKVGHRRTGGSPHQHVIVGWIPGKPVHQSATTGW